MDNAPAHGKEFIEETKDSMVSGGWDIQMKPQPANLPGTNINDLGFFNVLQKLQETHQFTNLMEMMEKVENCFENIIPRKLDDIFYTLMMVMIAIMCCGVTNNYPLDHIHKDELRKKNELPYTLSCPEEALIKAAESLALIDEEIERENVAHALGFTTV